MRILLLGGSGQVGWEAQRAFACLGELVTLDYPQVDFAHPESLPGLVRSVAPGVIINAVAYTAVDRAESEPETARLVNGVAPGVLAEAACRARAFFLHFSTDYVFDGRKNAPYVEEDTPNPLNQYGRSKLEGEQAVAAAGGSWITLRTSWVYSNRRESFVAKVLEWSRKNAVLRVVDDQVAGPTWARMLAEAAAMLLARAGADPFSALQGVSGVYHLAGAGWCSRKEWAEEILKLDPDPSSRLAHEVLPAKSAEFPSPAERPLFSALDCTKFERTFGLRLPPWRDALRLAMDRGNHLL